MQDLKRSKKQPLPEEKVAILESKWSQFTKYCNSYH